MELGRPGGAARTLAQVQQPLARSHGVNHFDGELGPFLSGTGRVGQKDDIPLQERSVLIEPVPKRH